MVDTERRKVLGGLIAATTGLAVNAQAAAVRGAGVRDSRAINIVKPKFERIRFGFIGVGMRGHELLRLLLSVDGVEVKALCDIHGPTLEKAAKLIVDRTGATP